MTRIRKMGQGQRTFKTSSTATRDHRKSKRRIGEGFIAEISEGDTFEKPSPMETDLLKCFTKRSTGNSIRKCKSENFVFGCLCSDLPVPDGCSPSQGVSKPPLRTCYTIRMEFPRRLVKHFNRPVSIGAGFSKVSPSDISAIKPSPIGHFNFLWSLVPVLEVLGVGWP